MEATTNGPALTRDQLRLMSDLVQRAGFARKAGVTFRGKRDLYDTLGYTWDLTYDDYYQRYLRGDIAARIVNAFPAATWRHPPRVRERHKPDNTAPSPFEQAFQGLADRLRLFQALERVDRLASIGHYAVLVLGLRGQTDFATPARNAPGPDGLLYLAAYSEQHSQIADLVMAPDSPLFGQPARYRLDFSRGGQGQGALASGFQAVHASRVLHVAEDCLEGTVYGTPRLRAVWNRLDDLEKVLGGSAEMFWQDAKRRLVLNLAPEATLDPDTEQALSAEVDEFMHHFRNFLRLQGMQDIVPLVGQVPDPSGHVDRLLDLISGTIGIPKRMLTGSERGELASSQDESNWAERIGERQQHHAGPSILRPFLDRLIHLRVLPVPRGGYDLEWPNLTASNDKEEAEVARTWAQALKEYAGQFLSPADIIPPEVFLTDFIGLTPEQVARITEAVARLEATDRAESGDEELEDAA